jgi:hypothetical protein
VHSPLHGSPMTVYVEGPICQLSSRGDPCPAERTRPAELGRTGDRLSPHDPTVEQQPRPPDLRRSGSYSVPFASAAGNRTLLWNDTPNPTRAARRVRVSASSAVATAAGAAPIC